MVTKTIAVLDDSELKDGQMKEVSFEDGKVLLSRIGNKIHATSAFCTHYGAPLAKGVLSSDGRVVCPWHGACFNVCSGDIEDSPAPQALHAFQTVVRNGKIHVTANPASTLKSNMSRHFTMPMAGINSMSSGVVIVGGGAGAFNAVNSLREHGYASPITIISKEAYTPIDRTKLSKALITDSAKVEWRSAADLKINLGTNIRLSTEVSSIDTEKKTIILDGGKDSIPFDKLILATGANPRRLPIDGAKFENVYTFRGIDDSQKVDAAAKEGKKVVVIGSSFISMELVVAFSQRKLASINVIGMEEFPFETVLGKKVGEGIMKYHEGKGVKFHMLTKVEKIVASEENPNLAVGVVIDGTTLPCDFVIMGVGVAPATEFLKDSGIDLEKDGSIKVDKYFRVKSGKDTKNIYAIGDIATYPAANGEFIRVEHWNVAGNHGRAVGSTIAGKPEAFLKTPVFWSAQGQQLRYCGYGANHDNVIIKGNPEELKFIAYYVKEGRIVAVATMQNDPVVSKSAELLRLGVMPSPEDIEGGKDLLSIEIPSAKNEKVTVASG